MMRTINCPTTTLRVLAWSLVLLDCSCWLITMGQEGFFIETQPNTAHSGQACLRFDRSRQTRPDLVTIHALPTWLEGEGFAG